MMTFIAIELAFIFIGLLEIMTLLLRIWKVQREQQAVLLLQLEHAQWTKDKTLGKV